MSRSRFWLLTLVTLTIGAATGCQTDDDGDDGASCSPADPTCGVPATSLTVIGVSPADGTKHVDPSAPVVVTFSGPVQQSSVTATSLAVGNAQGVLTVSGATATFTPSSPLVMGTDHQVRVDGVRALDGSRMGGMFTSSFTTRAQPVCAECPATAYSRGDVEAQGKVVQTPQGFTVEGTLSLAVGNGRRVTFHSADLDVRFDGSGRLQSVSGKVQIPSPHDRIAFAEPARADVGLFAGRFLNEHRELPIRLKDDTDYFVYDVQTSLSLSVATGETGAGATRPIVVRAPGGGRILMIVDYRDPMYFVYGEVEGLGAAGMGWSLNGRIPFAPKQAVDGLGAFDGRNTRVGTFPYQKVLEVTGQMVDNASTELHLTQQDPFAANRRAGYRAGFNGALALDLFLKDIVGLEIPIADGSGGVRVDASTQGGVSGYAFARGKTAATNSWWPAFIPARPVREMETQARIESDGRFRVRVDGEYGWDFPSGRQAMVGSFELTDQAMTLAGAIRADSAVSLRVAGRVTAASTTVTIEPPALLTEQIQRDVNAQVLPQIAAAQKAWADLEKATADYQFELSLRGVRALIPGIVDVAKQALTNGITTALRDHENTIYYSTLRGLVDDQAKPYYDKLDALKTAAARADNATTRAALHTALTELADAKIFKFSHTVYFLGQVVWSVTFERRIMSDTQAAQLDAAAGYIRYIPETSNIMISMRQIYDRIPDKLIFEQVRDDLRNGVLQMARIDELGVVVPHAGQRTFNLYSVIAGRRYEVGPVQALTVGALAERLSGVMITALRAN
jgi:hypothetical protein